MTIARTVKENWQSSDATVMKALALNTAVDNDRARFTAAQTDLKSGAKSAVKTRIRKKISPFIPLIHQFNKLGYQADFIQKSISSLEDKYAKLLDGQLKISPGDDKKKKQVETELKTIRRELDGLIQTHKAVTSSLRELVQEKDQKLRESYQSPASDLHKDTIKQLQAKTFAQEQIIKGAITKVSRDLPNQMSQTSHNIFVSLPDQDKNQWIQEGVGVKVATQPVSAGSGYQPT